MGWDNLHSVALAPRTAQPSDAPSEVQDLSQLVNISEDEPKFNHLWVVARVCRFPVAKLRGEQTRGLCPARDGVLQLPECRPPGSLQFTQPASHGCPLSVWRRRRLSPHDVAPTLPQAPARAADGCRRAPAVISIVQEYLRPDVPSAPL